MKRRGLSYIFMAMAILASVVTGGELRTAFASEEVEVVAASEETPESNTESEKEAEPERNAESEMKWFWKVPTLQMYLLRKEPIGCPSL